MSEEQKQETMADFEKEIDSSLKPIAEGDIMTGTIIDVTDTHAIVDLKYYAQGIIRAEDFTDDPAFSIKESVTAGDSVTAAVLKKDDGEGNILLSKKLANDSIAWEKLKEMETSNERFTVKVQGVVNGGVVAYVEGIRGFIPASKLSLSYVEDLNDYLLKELEVEIITLEPERKKLVLSAREILREKEAEARKEKISNVQVGLVTEGVVETIKPYGAFVKLSNGLSGLVHISQISEKRIKTPDVVLTEGDTVKVKIIALKEGKISLSMKALNDTSAREIEEEKYDLPKGEDLTTNLGDLFKGLDLDLK